MKKLIPLLICLMTALVSCTRNNGDIGPLFGLWKLTSIEVRDGASIPAAYEGNIFWGFQSSVIMLEYVDNEHNSIRSYGNFVHSGDDISIDFPDDNMPPFPILGLPRQATLQVIELKGSTLQLRYEPETGGSILYNFKKW